jgi:phage terminase small subunit
MTRLDNTRQERFVLAVVEGKSGSQAYRLAGYCAAERSAEAAASRLLRNGKVATRLEELRRELAEKTEITVETVKRMLLEDREAARLAGHPKEMHVCTQKLAALYGISLDLEVASHGRAAPAAPARHTIDLLAAARPIDFAAAARKFG